MSTDDQPASPTGPPPPDTLPDYHRTIRLLSDRIVEAQRPLRILNAVKWDDEIEERFFAGGCSELPPVTREYYDERPPGFDPDAKRQEFYAIERGPTTTPRCSSAAPERSTA